MVRAHNIPTRSGQDSRYEHVINQHDNLLWGRPAMMWLGIVACDHYQCPVPGADTPDALPPPIACDLTCTNMACITMYSLDSSTQSLV